MGFNPLVIGAAAIGVTLVYASVLDLRSRRVPFRTWYPMLAIGAPCTLWFYASLYGDRPSSVYALIAFSAIFAAAFYLFGRLGLIGGADAWALVFILPLALSEYMFYVGGRTANMVMFPIAWAGFWITI